MPFLTTLIANWRVVAIAAAVIAVFSAGWIANGWRYERTIAEQKAEAARQLSEAQAATAAHQQRVSDLNLQVEHDHAEHQASIEAAYLANRDLAAELDRLRAGRGEGDKRAVPGNAGTTPGADQGAAGGNLSGSYADLADIARDADRAAEYARTCHDWAVSLPQ